MPCPQCGKDSSPSPWFTPYCSIECKSHKPVRQAAPTKPPAPVTKNVAPAPKDVRFACRWCHANVSFKSNTMNAQHRVCSKACYEKIGRYGAAPGLQVMDLLFTKKTHEMAGQLTDQDLGRVAKTHPLLTNNAVRGQLGPWYEDHAAKYVKGGNEETVGRDRMIEIAVASYRTACKLKQKGLAVVLYRVKDKRGRLTDDETSTQAVCGAIPTAKDVWPLERTAAWLQGAMRARVTFLMITDPRGDGNLIGGADRKSDAVYVRELFQISQTRYIIGKAEGREIPAGWTSARPAAIFKMVPPSRDTGPLPLIPKMSEHMDYSHTWDSAKSSLAVDADDSTRMAEHVKDLFETAGASLGVAPY